MPARTLTALLLAAAAITPAAARSTCGDTTVVRAGDTLSAIAARCDVEEARILAANPAVNGSSDLIVGETLALNAEAGSTDETGSTGTLEKLGTIAGKATQSLAHSAAEAGDAIGEGVNSFLDDHPGVERRVRDLTGGGAASDARVAVAPQPGADALSVTASGLPADAPVVVTGGPAGAAQQRLAEGRTDGDGRFAATVPLPAGRTAADYRVVVRATDGGWKAGGQLAAAR